MKRLTLSFLLILAFVSCKKSNDDYHHSINGRWYFHAMEEIGTNSIILLCNLDGSNCSEDGAFDVTINDSLVNIYAGPVRCSPESGSTMDSYQQALNLGPQSNKTFKIVIRRDKNILDSVRLIITDSQIVVQPLNEGVKPVKPDVLKRIRDNWVWTETSYPVTMMDETTNNRVDSAIKSKGAIPLIPSPGHYQYFVVTDSMIVKPPYDYESDTKYGRTVYTYNGHIDSLLNVMRHYKVWPYGMAIGTRSKIYW